MRTDTMAVLENAANQLGRLSKHIQEHINGLNEPPPPQVQAEPGFGLATDEDKELPRGCRYWWDGQWKDNDDEYGRPVQHSRILPHEIPLIPYPNADTLEIGLDGVPQVVVKYARGKSGDHVVSKHAGHVYRATYDLFAVNDGFRWIVEDDPDADTRPLLSSVEFTALVDMPDAYKAKSLDAWIAGSKFLYRQVRGRKWHSIFGLVCPRGNEQWIIADDYRDDRKDGSK